MLKIAVSDVEIHISFTLLQYIIWLNNIQRRRLDEYMQGVSGLSFVLSLWLVFINF